MSRVTVERAVMKRYWINAMQMSAAVTIGLLLAPVVVSTEHMIHLFRH